MISGTDVEADNSSHDSSVVSGSGVTFKLGAKEISITKFQIPYIIMIAASIVLLCNIFGFPDNRAYGIAVAVVTMAIAIAVLAISATMQATWKMIGIYVNYFLMAWNFVGVIILTFQGPFYATSNGYFAIWAMAICSMIVSKFKYEEVTDRLKGATALAGLTLASSILTIAIIFLNIYDWRMIYSLIVSILTWVVCSIFIYLDQKGDSAKQVKKPTLGIFACLWIVVVIVLTFPGGLFLLTGNGYFAAWGGLICCVYAAAMC